MQQFYFACDQVGVGLINDVIVSSCTEISRQVFVEESERVRKQKYALCLTVHHLYQSLSYREEREKLLNKIAWNFVTHLIEQTTLSEVDVITRDSLKLVTFYLDGV